MTTIPSLTAAGAIDPTAHLALLSISADDEYKMTLERARGMRVYSALDYQVPEDGTDGSTEAQALFDDCTNATETLRGIALFAGEDYVIDEDARGYGIDLASSCVIMGSTSMASSISLTSTNTDVPLFQCAVATASIFANLQIRSIRLDCTNGNTVSDQHCFQLGKTSVAAVSARESRMWDAEIRNFSGAFIYIVHNSTQTSFGSSASFGDLILSNLGAAIKDDDTISTAFASGTNNTFINIHSKNAWNDQSPSAYYCDLKNFRETNIYNYVFEGNGPGATKTGIFRFGSGVLIHGLHPELTGNWPTYFADLVDPVTSGTITHEWYNTRPFVGSMAINIARSGTVVRLHGCSIETNNTLSTALITDNTSDGSWRVEFINSSGAVAIDPSHIGRVTNEYGGGTANPIALTQFPKSLVEFNSNEHGWLTGMPNLGVPDVFKFGTNFAQFYLQNVGGISYDEIGIVDDPDEGRVFAIQGSVSYPRLAFNFALPSEFLDGTTGAQVHWGCKFKYIHNEASDPTIRLDAGTASFRQGINASPAADNATWYTSMVTALLTSASTTFTSSGSTATTKPWEIRIAWMRMGLGGHAPTIGPGGKLVSSTANQETPLEWWVYDASDEPTWGDYKLGDTAKYKNPDTGTPAWCKKCTTKGAKAAAHPGDAANVYIGQWCLADTNKIYKCITEGTTGTGTSPTGTGSDITDGTVHWAYHDTAAVFTEF